MKKLAHYRPHCDELAAQGIRYRPKAISCYGRLHPEAVHVLAAVAQKAVRRYGFVDHVPILRRLQQAIGVRLQVRLVSMVRACLPHLSSDELQLLHGCVGPDG